MTNQVQLQLFKTLREEIKDYIPSPIFENIMSRDNPIQHDPMVGQCCWIKVTDSNTNKKYKIAYKRGMLPIMPDSYIASTPQIGLLFDKLYQKEFNNTLLSSITGDLNEYIEILQHWLHPNDTRPEDLANTTEGVRNGCLELILAYYIMYKKFLTSTVRDYNFLPNFEFETASFIAFEYYSDDYKPATIDDFISPIDKLNNTLTGANNITNLSSFGLDVINSFKQLATNERVSESLPEGHINTTVFDAGLYCVDGITVTLDALRWGDVIVKKENGRIVDWKYISIENIGIGPHVKHVYLNDDIGASQEMRLILNEESYYNKDLWSDDKTYEYLYGIIDGMTGEFKKNNLRAVVELARKGGWPYRVILRDMILKNYIDNNLDHTSESTYVILSDRVSII